MEKRAFKRQVLNHNAEFSTPSHAPQACVIKDFCKGGLFIEFGYQPSELLHSPAQPIEIGDPLQVKFKSAAPLKLEYQLETKVARVIEGAMGLQITSPNTDALHALYHLAHSAESTSSSATTSSQNKALLAKCRELIAGFISASAQGLLEQVNDALMLQASKAENNAEETVYFEVINKLDKYRDKIIKHFSNSTLREVDNWINGKPISLPGAKTEEQETELGLVDKEDFEDWLVVKVIITRAEQQYQDELFQLNLRMSEISPDTVGNHNNPINPTYISHAFYKAMEPMALSRDMAKLTFSVFEDQCIANLSTLYSKLNKLMISEGVLADINERKVKVIHTETPTPPTGASDKDTGEDGEGPTAEAKSKPLPSKATTAPAKDSQTTDTGSTGNITHIADSKDESLYQRIQSQQMLAKNAFSTVQNLLKMQKQLALGDTGNDQGFAANGFDTGAQPTVNDPEAAPVSYFEQDFVVDQLTQLQKLAARDENAPADTPLLDRVRQQLGDNSRQLNDYDNNTIEITDNFFSSMMDNQAIANSIKPAIRKLEIPLLKVLLEDSSFFEMEEHPLRLVLNRLAKLGAKGGQLNKAVEANIEHMVTKITQEFDRDTEVFDEVLGGLDQLLEKQQQTAQRNTERVIASCEGLQTIDNAKDAVRRLINYHLGGKWVPRVLNDLLDQGWRELLVFTLLRDGSTSSIWKSYTKVVDLLSQLTPNKEDNSAILKQGAGLYKIIETGIKEAPSGKKQMQKLLPALSHLLTPKADSPEAAFVEISSDMETPDEAFSAIDDSKIQDRALARWIKRAKRLDVADWIEFNSNEDPIQLRLAWVGKDHHKFVFVNHQGMKVMEFSLLELAGHLQSREAQVIDNPDQAFVDQSLDQMVQNMYEQMNYQATHDELTGLINLKEFERQLEQYLHNAKRNQSTHSVCHLDLDQFKVVNNVCGRTAGDQLLKEIGTLMLQNLPTETVIAHLGADEFLLLLPQTSGKEGRSVANQIRAKIESYRFTWKDDLHTVGASIGVVELDESTADISNIISAADSARLSAKEGGGNRVHLYQENDEERKKRSQVMDKITRLNKALDEERLQLRCQKIGPVAADSTELPHYEILLSLEDEQGLQLAPGEFIHAAERYHRMQAVDRWVIRNVFEWMASNTAKLKQISGCTINLSGHSLNDESLMGYIFEELISTDIPREKICFEITETTAVANLADVADFITEMKSLGFRFALDDFGTGFSSYKYLKNLPVDYVKIDGSFVKNIATDTDDYAMVKSINEMAHMMGKRTVAEYVENDDILLKLREIGVDFAQGYGVEKPLLLHSIFERAA